MSCQANRGEPRKISSTLTAAAPLCRWCGTIECDHPSKHTTRTAALSLLQRKKQVSKKTMCIHARESALQANIGQHFGGIKVKRQGYFQVIELLDIDELCLVSFIHQDYCAVLVTDSGFIDDGFCRLLAGNILSLAQWNPQTVMPCFHRPYAPPVPS